MTTFLDEDQVELVALDVLRELEWEDREKNVTLAELRDALLPKLISGAIPDC